MSKFNKPAAKAGAKPAAKSASRPKGAPADTSAKPGLHPRNPHRFRYDFVALVKSSPELKPFLIETPRGETSINFSSAKAVKALNRALLEHFYRVKSWDIPEGYLCPPIPGRADYIHTIADVLAATHNGIVPTGARIKALDIGTGASAIYPIIGTREYGWSFVATEFDPTAAEAADTLMKHNPDLDKRIEVRQQRRKENIFKGVVQDNELYDITLCNPPFYSSAKEAQSANQRKNRNLKRPTGKSKRNFGGQDHELWFPGGERAFVENIITESKDLGERCLWFSALISNQDHLPKLEHVLQENGAVAHQVKSMAQGQKTSRLLIWSFLDEAARQQWVKRRFA